MMFDDLSHEVVDSSSHFPSFIFLGSLFIKAFLSKCNRWNKNLFRSLDKGNFVLGNMAGKPLLC